MFLVHFESLKKKCFILLRYYQVANFLQLKKFNFVMAKIWGNFSLLILTSESKFFPNIKKLHIFHRILHMLWLP